MRTDGSGEASFTVTADDDDIWRGGGSESVGIMVTEDGTGANNSVTLDVSDEASDEPDSVVVIIAADEVAENGSTTGYVQLRRGGVAKSLESGTVSIDLALPDQVP